jgi:hypothetical protein
MALLMLCIATATRRIETRQFSSSLYLATGKSPDKDQATGLSQSNPVNARVSL